MNAHAPNPRVDEWIGLPTSRAAAIDAGVTHYFTGKPCTHGHVARRYASNNSCEQCICERVYRRLGTEDGRAAIRSAEKNRYQANIEECREKNRKKEARRRARNPEHIRALDRAADQAFKAAFPDEWRRRKREEARRARAKDPARHLAKDQAYRAANPDKPHMWRNRRRARLRGAEGAYTEADARRIRAAQKDRCAYCPAKLHGGGHLDHIHPLSKGGSNRPSNLQWLCEACNLSKSNRDPIEFAQDKGLLL